MIIVIITDSLGLPRRNLANETVWTKSFINLLKCEHLIYTYFDRGKSSDDLVKH